MSAMLSDVDLRRINVETDILASERQKNIRGLCGIENDAGRTASCGRWCSAGCETDRRSDVFRTPVCFIWRCPDLRANVQILERYGVSDNSIAPASWKDRQSAIRRSVIRLMLGHCFLF